MHPFCPICGATDFIEFNNRPQARCANCGAMERTRLLYGILNRQGVLSPKMSVLHLAPEPGLAGRLRRLATRYVPADIDISQYLTFLPEIQRLDLCDFQSGDLGHFDLILHMHVLEHVPCSIDTVLRKLGQSLNPGGRMYFSVPIRSAAETDEDLNPSLTGDERKVRFGQHDYQRIFGDADVVEMFRRALGPDLHLVDPLAYFTQQEVRLMGVKIDVGKLSGHSIFCHQA